MPNYRNKNRNRNKNKQRNKQQQQKAENTKRDSKTDTAAPTTNSQESPSPSPPPLSPPPPPPPPPADVASQTTANELQQLNASALALDNKNVARIEAANAASTAIVEKLSDVTISASNTTTTNDTVLNEPSVCENYSESDKNYAVTTDDNMGNEKSKLTETKVDAESSSVTVSKSVTPPKSPLVGKVIVHRIVCEDTNKVNQKTEALLTTLTQQQTTLDEASNVVTHDLVSNNVQQTAEDCKQSKEEEEKVSNVNKVVKPDVISEKKTEEEPFKILIDKILSSPEKELPLDQPKTKAEMQHETTNAAAIHQMECKEVEQQQPTNKVTIKEKETEKPVPQEPAKVIIHKVALASEDTENDADESSSQSDITETVTQHQVKVIVHEIHVEGKDDAVEERPIITSPVQRESIQLKAKPSTSDVRIVEISDESLSDLEELRSPVVSEAESSMEYSDELQRVSDSITEISSTTSSSTTSTTTKQKQARKQKRIALEHHFLPQMLNPRFLDSISEENNLKSTSAAAAATIQSQQNVKNSGDPKKLRLLCAETVASLPYGDEVLEELATVAQNIGESRAVQAVKAQENNMPYPLPQLPHIDDLQLSLKVGNQATQPHLQQQQQQQQESLQSWLGVPTNTDPKVLVCLSPSQRSFIQKKPEQNPDDLLDAHQKFVERRGYHEYTKEQLDFLEREKLAEQQLLQTAALMKKLRKSITPPPPQIPPPPVPVKSSETATKAQNLSKRTITTTTTSSVSHTQNSSDDANLPLDKEHIKAFANGEGNGEENKHRLLSIIQDTSESNANKQKFYIPATSSSHENNSRQTANDHSASTEQQVTTATAASTLNNSKFENSQQFPQLSKQKVSGSMQSVENSLGQMFPTMGSSNIFDKEHKRFSNIESSSKEPFCSQLTDTQPKRYSSIETHYFETQKRCENGQVVQDFTTSKHETKTSGDKPDAITNFPLKTSLSSANNSFFSASKEPEILNKPKAQNNNDQEIMSALKLNKQSSDIETEITTAKTLESETTIKTIEEKTSQNENVNDEHKSREEQQYETKESILKRGIQDSYEEFRQRAKAAADTAATLPTLNISATKAAPLTAKVTSNGDNNDVNTSIKSSASVTSTTEQKKSTTVSHDHERLFKEFDDLSKQLHKELETSKAEREQREKSASMFDLNRVHMRHKQQIEEYNKSRHEHLKELEQQIERSMRSRSVLFNKTPEPVANTDTVDHQIRRTYEIPIQIENGYTSAPKHSAAAYEEAPPVPELPKTYNIPIQMENSNNGSQLDDARFRRAESMFNLNDDMHHRQRTLSNQAHLLRTDDDWSKYASDLGSSENIARPFAKEVEICYQRRPGGIRAPRLTASTNDLSFSNQHSYDQYNAYNVRRHHAPMLNRAPETARPKFGSCYSMIERDPNPKYISTTTRRGVSPAPQASGYFPLEGCHVREEDIRQRRASLPREIHEQQLKYIASKEEELRTEFERLQAERKRLMEEAQKAQTMQMSQVPASALTPTRPLRDSYRSTQKLPTLTEDEVFRQQMAEEWLNKVAEREKRRLQNIIKISKIHEDEATLKHNADMEQEFLSRVKERRHKLAMPADSDWESGAESQPVAHAQHSETEDVPTIKIMEGEKETSLRRLPRHLREFAKFSNHQKENIEGGHREAHQQEERSEETTENSMSRAVKKSSVVKTVKTLRAPMLPANGHDNDNVDYTSRSDYDTSSDNYYTDVNSHIDDDGSESDVSTSKSHTYQPFSNFPNTSNQVFSSFPSSFDEMFGKSPFRNRIFEEFDNYWRKFHYTGNSDF